MIRRLTSLVAAIALVYAMAAPPLAACEGSHAATTNVAGAMTGEAHSMSGEAAESDCPEPGAPAEQEHDSNCLVTCLSMVGCSSQCFVTVAPLQSVIGRASPAPTTTTQPHPSRSLEPDRPPPRS